MPFRRTERGWGSSGSVEEAYGAGGPVAKPGSPDDLAHGDHAEIARVVAVGAVVSEDKDVPRRHTAGRHLPRGVLSEVRLLKGVAVDVYGSIVNGDEFPRKPYDSFDEGRLLGFGRDPQNDDLSPAWGAKAIAEEVDNHPLRSV